MKFHNIDFKRGELPSSALLVKNSEKRSQNKDIFIQSIQKIPYQLHSNIQATLE